MKEKKRSRGGHHGNEKNIADFALHKEETIYLITYMEIYNEAFGSLEEVCVLSSC